MKLYVGNLPYNTSEDDLRTLFSQYGNVESVADDGDCNGQCDRACNLVELSRRRASPVRGHPRGGDEVADHDSANR